MCLTQDLFFLSHSHTVITSEAISLLTVSLSTNSQTSSTLTSSEMDAGYSAALTPATCDATNISTGRYNIHSAHIYLQLKIQI